MSIYNFCVAKSFYDENPSCANSTWRAEIFLQETYSDSVSSHDLSNNYSCVSSMLSDYEWLKTEFLFDFVISDLQDKGIFKYGDEITFERDLMIRAYFLSTHWYLFVNEISSNSKKRKFHKISYTDNDFLQDLFDYIN